MIGLLWNLGQYRYWTYIVNLSEYEIQLITDEGSEDILDHKRGLAGEVTHDLGLGHEAVDLSLEVRLSLKIADLNRAYAACRLSQSNDGVQLHKTLTQLLTDPIGERYLCACLLDCCIRFDSQST